MGNSANHGVWLRTSQTHRLRYMQSDALRGGMMLRPRLHRWVLP